LSRVYVDTNVFLYAAGADSRFRQPCVDFLRAVVERKVSGETGLMTLQEVVHHRQRRGDRQATARGREVLSICTVVHPVDRHVGVSALDLIDRHPGLETADAIHAATALTQGIALVVSADDDFDQISGLERVDPLDRAALADLLRG
jgi:uncharacterized protein